MTQENNFSDIEKEIISLNIIVEVIDSIINLMLFKLQGEDAEKEVIFHTEIHQNFFYIIVVDFLSKTDRRITGLNQEETCIDLLERICEEPNFNKNDSISSLISAKNSFESWIEKKVKIDIYLPSIDRECSLNLTREDIVKICGNISKHHFARLSWVSRKICEILREDNTEISPHESLELLDDFYEEFHDNILNYHASHIAEMLNNINWGIYNYLLPEYKKFKESNSNESCISIENKFVRRCYMRLMNFVERGPYLKKFESTKYLKKRY